MGHSEYSPTRFRVLSGLGRLLFVPCRLIPPRPSIPWCHDQRKRRRTAVYALCFLALLFRTSGLHHAFSTASRNDRSTEIDETWYVDTRLNHERLSFRSSTKNAADASADAAADARADLASSAAAAGEAAASTLEILMAHGDPSTAAAVAAALDDQVPRPSRRLLSPVASKAELEALLKAESDDSPLQRTIEAAEAAAEEAAAEEAAAEEAAAASAVDEADAALLIATDASSPVDPALVSADASAASAPPADAGKVSESDGTDATVAPPPEHAALASAIQAALDGRPPAPMSDAAVPKEAPPTGAAPDSPTSEGEAAVPATDAPDKAVAETTVSAPNDAKTVDATQNAAAQPAAASEPLAVSPGAGSAEADPNLPAIAESLPTGPALSLEPTIWDEVGDAPFLLPSA
ncbi:hypothetical protein CXG81DRAFT_17228 [Caulochytrium protostelioides]|uniref:Uncharacterized protein n=1 Tax=Caulochytrium protostelioides TaxID=1555241 RepID=A0A4P9XCK7_9FUNG|nr:hypothetical protein CXG81DRAFT_17228 [Caulochytrium protostelioides]|eukprot:RKP03163.1 hypothetical protein CXG81DRAFT_17228 [Caulochytrium protostelioides]